ncbi:hypothetical protein CR513_00481, partial [Mucuna pruriens]
MIVKDDREIESGSSIGELGTSSESKSLSDGSHYDGDLLVSKAKRRTKKGKGLSLKGHGQRAEKNFKDISTPALGGLIIRGGLKRTQEEVHQKVDHA